MISPFRSGTAPGPSFAPVAGGGPGLHRCTTCRRALEERHADTCTAPLATCARPGCHQVVIRVDTRPAAGTLTIACPKCGRENLVAESFWRAV